MSNENASDGRTEKANGLSNQHPVTFWTYFAKVERVVDGDTIDFEVDIGFNTFKRVRTRLLGVDTHETYGVKKESEEYKQGKIEANFVEEWLEDSDELFIQTEKDEQGKYGRWLARVYDEEFNCLNERLIEEFDVGLD